MSVVCSPPACRIQCQTQRRRERNARPDNFGSSEARKDRLIDLLFCHIWFEALKVKESGVTARDVIVSKGIMETNFVQRICVNRRLWPGRKIRPSTLPIIYSRRHPEGTIDYYFTLQPNKRFIACFFLIILYYSSHGGKDVRRVCQLSGIEVCHSALPSVEHYSIITRFISFDSTITS
jgi:hypothetical protein